MVILIRWDGAVYGIAIPTLHIFMISFPASCLIVNGHALLLASWTAHGIPAIVHNLTADLTAARNAAVALWPYSC